MSQRARAKSLLVHYFQHLADRTGIMLGSDSTDEIEQIVDLIIEAAVDEARGA